MNQNDEFKIPKNQKTIKIHLHDQTILEGIIFIEYTNNEDTTHSRLISFIKDKNIFFPISVNGEKIEIINKNNVKMFEVYAFELKDQSFALMCTLPATIHFVDSTTIQGDLIADAPTESFRLSDCLNLPPFFIILRVQDKIFYINKMFIKKVI